MNKSVYLLVAGILIDNFCSLRLFALQPDTALGLSFAWAIFGLFYYTLNKPADSLRIDTSSNRRYVWLIFLGVFFSMTSVYVYHDQSFVATFISQRQLYLFLYFFVLLRMAPSVREVFAFVRWYSILSLGVWILSIINPYSFDRESEQIAYLLSGESGDIGFVSTTLAIVVLYYYFILGQAVAHFSVKGWCKVLFWLAFFILVQNRSMLFLVLILTVYSILRIRSRYRYALIVVSAIACVTVIVLTKDILLSLHEETVEQLSDLDYNRWNALKFFFTERDNYPLYCMLFGNGTPAADSAYLHSLVQATEFSRAYISDIGLLGNYFYYGLLPLGVIYFIIFKTLQGGFAPYFLKLMAVHILLVPTIFSISFGTNTFFFCIVMYLYCYYRTPPFRKTSRSFAQSLRTC